MACVSGCGGRQQQWRTPAFAVAAKGTLVRNDNGGNLAAARRPSQHLWLLRTNTMAVVCAACRCVSFAFAVHMPSSVWDIRGIEGFERSFSGLDGQSNHGAEPLTVDRAFVGGTRDSVGAMNGGEAPGGAQLGVSMLASQASPSFAERGHSRAGGASIIGDTSAAQAKAGVSEYRSAPTAVPGFPVLVMVVGILAALVAAALVTILSLRVGRGLQQAAAPALLPPKRPADQEPHHHGPQSKARQERQKQLRAEHQARREAEKLAEELAEQQRVADEASRRAAKAAEEAQKVAREEAAKKAAEDAKARQQAEAELAGVRLRDEAERRKTEAEKAEEEAAAAKRRAELENRRKKAEAEAAEAAATVERLKEQAAKRKAEEDALREAEAKAAEEEQRRKAEAAKKKADDEAAAADRMKRLREEAAVQKALQEAQAATDNAKKAKEDARKKAEEDAKKKAEDEAHAQLAADNARKAREDAKKRAEEQAAAKPGGTAPPVATQEASPPPSPRSSPNSPTSQRRGRHAAYGNAPAAQASVQAARKLHEAEISLTDAERDLEQKRIAEEEIQKQRSVGLFTKKAKQLATAQAATKLAEASVRAKKADLEAHKEALLGSDIDRQRPLSEPVPENTVIVKIFYARGLNFLNFKGQSTVVDCQVKHKHSTMVGRATTPKHSTHPSHDVVNPSWGEEFTITPWHVGEALEFKVHDKGSVWSETKGHVLLPSRDFYPDGFHGELPISGFSDAVLAVRIDADTTGGAHVGPLKRLEGPAFHNFYNAAPQKLEITIVQATGLDRAKTSVTGVWATCEVKRRDTKKSKSKVKTPTVGGGGANPKWNETLILEDWYPGEPLEFAVHDNLVSETALVPSYKFQSDPFEDDLLLNGRDDATLHVRIHALKNHS